MIINIQKNKTTVGLSYRQSHIQYLQNNKDNTVIINNNINNIITPNPKKDLDTN